MRDLNQVIVLCTWERRLFYSRNASREYMIMVPANCRERGEGSRARTGIPSHPRRVVKCLIVLCSGNRDELWPDRIRDLKDFPLC